MVDPYNGSELYIIGTLNSSNILANRTRRLIDEIKPDTVFIQTSEEWWKIAKHLTFVKSQQEMTKAHEQTSLKKLGGVPAELCKKPSLAMLKFHIFNFFFKRNMALPIEYNPFVPGLEIKYTLEEAEKLNAKIVYLGTEFNEATKNRFFHEKRTTILKAIINTFRLPKRYQFEIIDFSAKLSNSNIETFIEGNADSKQVSWFIGVLEKLFPEIKRIIVDRRDEDIFKQIIENKGKKNVVVVNQHHMEGIESHWCNAFGLKPTFNTYSTDPINPIGDMDLRRQLYNKMYHVISREVKSSRSRSSPASLTDEINIYHREFNHQFEHRNV